MNNKPSVVDIHEAFDTMIHRILLGKAEYMGVRGIQIDHICNPYCKTDRNAMRIVCKISTCGIWEILFIKQTFLSFSKMQNSDIYVQGIL